MDVHPPHSPIRGVKDFFLHLFTITVGLLIALGLEAAVEHGHQRHQLAEAREAIRAELEENKRNLTEVKPKLADQQKALDAMLAEVSARRAHAAGVRSAPRIPLVGVTLSRAHWETARASGALALMPQDEASRLAGIYQVQAIVDEIQVQAVSGFAPLLGALPESDAVGAGEPLSAAELVPLEEKIRNSLGHSRVLARAVGELEKKYEGR